MFSGHRPFLLQKQAKRLPSLPGEHRKLRVIYDCAVKEQLSFAHEHEKRFTVNLALIYRKKAITNRYFV